MTILLQTYMDDEIWLKSRCEDKSAKTIARILDFSLIHHAMFLAVNYKEVTSPLLNQKAQEPPCHLKEGGRNNLARKSMVSDKGGLTKAVLISWRKAYRPALIKHIAFFTIMARAFNYS